MSSTGKYGIMDVYRILKEIAELPLEYQLELADMWDKYKAAKAEQERSTQWQSRNF